MSDKKMTIREGFEKARALYEQMGDAEMVAFFDGRIDQLNKKNSAELVAAYPSEFQVLVFHIF